MSISRVGFYPQVKGVSFNIPCVAATTTNITLSGLQTIDTVELTSGDRVLVKNQSVSSKNDIYIASSSSWVRSVDASTSDDFINGGFVYITSGSQNIGKTFVLNITQPFVLETGNISYSSYTSGSSGTSGTSGSSGTSGVGSLNGTQNYISKFTTTTELGMSLIYDDGTKIGIDVTDPTEKLDVNGSVQASGFKTPGGTATQALTANGGVFDLNLKLSIESQSTTGTTISFTADRVYGTLTPPETGNITANITNAKLGVTNIIIHNSATTPTFGSEFKKLSGSGNYVAGVVNYIYCTFITATEIIYSINQRS